MRHHHRHPSPLVRVATVFVVLLLACGGRQATVRHAFDGVEVARAGFVTWDAQHQLDLVAAAPTREAGADALARYREDRAAAERAFAVAYRLVAAAALDTSTPITQVLAAVEALATSIMKLRQPASAP